MTEYIKVPEPKVGSRSWLLQEGGIYVLAQGPGVFRGLACTHAGTGALRIVDGIPSDNGFFDHDDLTPDHPDYHRANGRPIYRAQPIVMGMWMLDAGFLNGLTIINKAEGTSCVATVVWLEHKPRKP